MSGSTDRERPTLPATYVEQWLSFLERRGVDTTAVLVGTGLVRESLDASEARVSPLAFDRMVVNSFPLAKDPSLGYAFGLDLRPTSHGFLGYALLTCDTLGEAIRLGERFGRLRTEAARIRFSVDGETAIIELEDSVPLGPLRQFVLEGITGAIVRLCSAMLGSMPEGAVIWVDYPEPSYYREFRDQLPPVLFERPANQLRFSAVELERPLALADRSASRVAVAQLERELTLLGNSDETWTRVEAILRAPNAGFPDLEAVAARLHMSSRTLKRRLRAQRRSFQQLLDDARLARATSLLRDPGVSVEQVAIELGYADPANFTRAFRRWTGEPPSAFRLR